MAEFQDGDLHPSLFFWSYTIANGFDAQGGARDGIMVGSTSHKKWGFAGEGGRGARCSAFRRRAQLGLCGCDARDITVHLHGHTHPT